MRKTSLNVAAAVYDRLAAIKEKTGMTMTAALAAAVEMYHAFVMAEPGMVLGYIQPARPGDFDPEHTECAVCGEVCDPGGVWWRLGLTQGQLSAAGPLCARCATSE